MDNKQENSYIQQSIPIEQIQQDKHDLYKNHYIL